MYKQIRKGSGFVYTCANMLYRREDRMQHQVGLLENVLVSDIAIFVLKRDVILQLTITWSVM